MDLGDYTHSIVVQADSSSNAKAQVQTAHPNLSVTSAELTKTTLLMTVNGTVDGNPVQQQLWASGVTKEDITKSATKFFIKLNGGFKRKGKRVVEVTSLIEVE
jgi:hypothetical protein